jgi:hypothetical protein
MKQKQDNSGYKKQINVGHEVRFPFTKKAEEEDAVFS